MNTQNILNHFSKISVMVALTAVSFLAQANMSVNEQTTQTVNTGKTPTGLSNLDWVSIQSQISTKNPDTGNTITGFVWLDNNGDGLQDSSEPGFAQTVPDFGAPNIALYVTGSTDLIDFVFLDESSNGLYSFENLPDGDYYVCVSNEFRPFGLTVTTSNAGNDAIDSDFDFYACSYGIMLADGQVVMRDLGLVDETIDPDSDNQISGFVWLDNNGDGLQDPEEPGFAQTVPDFGVPNIALYVTGSTDLIDFVFLDESSNGLYSFENLPDGDYYVCVSNEFRPLGLTVTTSNAGDDAIDSDFDFYACSYGIIVAGGRVVMRDLGLASETTDPGTDNQISGFVWLDNNGDGLQDPEEPGFAQTVPDFGAPNIALYTTGSTELIDFVFLDESSNGEYTFENLPDGDYYVCVSNEFRPLGLTVTTSNAGDDAIDSDFDFYACSYGIIVAGGQVVMRDLGLVDETIDPDTGNEISGIVWNDANQDTRIDVDEDRVTAIIAIYELPEKVGSLVRHIITDQNGFYKFTNLPSGEYRVIAIDGDSESSVTASVSDTDSSVSIDFPVDKIPDIIEVDGTSCTLQDALNSITSTQQAGGCVRNNTDQDNSFILLEPGSQHPRVGLDPSRFGNVGRFGARYAIKIYGNGASINQFSTPSADSSPYNNARMSIINASLDSIHNGSLAMFGGMKLSHVDVSVAGSGFDGGSISFSYCRIGDASAPGASPADLNISDSIVFGDVRPAKSVVNSTIEGALFTNPLNNATIINSNVNKIVLRFLRQIGVNQLFSIGIDSIENSTIGGAFISEFSGTEVSEECFDAERVINPFCLLN